MSAQGHPRIEGVTAVLVAGGKSRRMGVDKRFIELDGRALIERVYDVLAGLFPEILVVAAEPVPRLTELGYWVVYDLIPDCATLGGLYTGLTCATHERVFAVGCDAPFLSRTVVAKMVGLAPEADVVMARLAVGLQPMHAVYSKACLPWLDQMARARNLKLQQIASAPGLRVRIVTEQELVALDRDLLSFLNVNTPADLELVKKLIGRSQTREEST
ncbi:molybdenum cofactor guanylyltransferase [Nitrospira sp. Kam-Ns4a]